MQQESPFAILGVFPGADDRKLLGEILSEPKFDLQFTETYDQTDSLVQLRRFDLILTEGRLPHNFTWKHMLRLAERTGQTRLIVADRLADERLWAEVLNLGGYDVLLKPFDRTEVVRVISQAERTARRGNSKGPARLTSAVAAVAAVAS